MQVAPPPLHLDARFHDIYLDSVYLNSVYLCTSCRQALGAMAPTRGLDVGLHGLGIEAHCTKGESSGRCRWAAAPADQLAKRLDTPGPHLAKSGRLLLCATLQNRQSL